jgi:hypothetical protein
MANKRGSRQYPGDDRLCFAMARLIQDGQAEDAWDAARQMAPKAAEKEYGTSLRGRVRRLQRHYISHESRWLAGEPEQRSGSLAAAARSMEPGFRQMRWLEQIVRERQAEEDARLETQRVAHGKLPQE